MTGPARHWTPEQVAFMRRQKRAGKTLKEIGELFEISGSRICQILDRAKQEEFRGKAQMQTATLEGELERAWLDLIESSTRGRTYYLTPNGRLVHGDKVNQHQHVEMVGTYTRAVGSCQFREDVFEAWDILRGKFHG